MTQGIPSGGVNLVNATPIFRATSELEVTFGGGRRGDNVSKGVFGGECDKERTYVKAMCLGECDGADVAEVRGPALRMSPTKSEIYLESVVAEAEL